MEQHPIPSNYASVCKQYNNKPQWTLHTANSGGPRMILQDKRHTNCVIMYNELKRIINNIIFKLYKQHS